ncbi:MAG: hypothetical protein ACXWV9_08495 [Flavisolibacter sp.]
MNIFNIKNKTTVAKKDINISENIDRGKKEEANSEISSEEISATKTEVKNANASGQGSMGRNDQEEKIDQPPANS